MKRLFIVVALLLYQLASAGDYGQEAKSRTKKLRLGGGKSDERATTKKLVSASSKDVVQNASSRVQAEAKSTEGEGTREGQEARENKSTFSRVSNSSDPARFKSIKVDAKTASNEFDFWSRQMSEHALFAHLGIEDPDLRSVALEMHQKLEDLRKKFQADPNNLKLMNQILPLLQKEREFQINLLKTLDSGKWVGWILPLFVNHVTLELDYFVDKLNGIKYTNEQEVTFWNRINSEHAAFAAHLLDPAERDLFLKADQMSVKFNNLPKSEFEMWRKLSLTASEQLDKFNKTAREKGKAVKSVIHPVLLDHVIREGERSILTLKNLGLNQESQKFAQQYAQQVGQYTREEEEPVAQQQAGY